MKYFHSKKTVLHQLINMSINKTSPSFGNNYEDFYFQQNVKKESDLQEENANDEKPSSPTNGMKEVASDEMFES